MRRYSAVCCLLLAALLLLAACSAGGPSAPGSSATPPPSVGESPAPAEPAEPPAPETAPPAPRESSAPETESAPEPITPPAAAPEAPRDPYEGLSCFTELPVYYPDATDIKYQIANVGSQPLTIHLEAYLQRRVGRIWVDFLPLDYGNTYANPMDVVTLEPGQSESFKLNYLYGLEAQSLPAGSYRISSLYEKTFPGPEFEIMEPGEYSKRERKMPDGLIFHTSNAVYDINAKEIPLKVCNRREADFLIGQGYGLERYRYGEWELVPKCVFTYAPDTSGTYLPPGYQGGGLLPLAGTYKQPLPPGVYRVRTEGGETPLYALFELARLDPDSEPLYAYAAPGYADGAEIVEALLSWSELESAGVTFREHRFTDPFTAPGYRSNYEENGVVIAVYEFDDAKAALAFAGRIDPNGYDYTKISDDGMTASPGRVNWDQPPHFYLCGRCVVLYCGEDSDILRHLRDLFGFPFAGGGAPDYGY